MNDAATDTEGVPLEWLAQWDVVFCGHYHKRQQVAAHRWYVGSAWQTRADESGQAKGFAVWHEQAGRIEWVDTAWGPRYHRITVHAGDKLDLSGVAQRDDLRVRVIGPGAEKAAESFHKAIATTGQFRVTVTPELEHVEARLDVVDGADLSSYVKAYVAQQAEPGEHGALLAVFKEITGVEIRP